MKRILWFTVILVLGYGGVATAGGKNGGLAASYVNPKGDFEQFVGDGFGLTAIFDYPLAGVVNITGSMGWYQFSGVTLIEGTNVKTDSSTLWEFAAGPQIDFGMLYCGVEGGYYTDLDEWGLVPNAGIRKDLLDFSLRYKVTDDGKFMALRAGFFF